MNTNTYITVPSSLLDNMIRYVEVSSFLGKRALDEIEVHRRAQKRASDLRGALLNYMIDVGVVAKHQKEAAAAMLNSHAETMQLLKSAVDKLVAFKSGRAKSAGDNGEAVDPGSLGLNGGYVPGNGPLTKEGEYDSLNDPVVGRKTSFVKASDRPLLALIGK